jgi:SAM-dependent methyltransferase
MPEQEVGALRAPTPSAVGLTRLSARLSFPAGGEALFRSVLRLVDVTPGQEFLVVPCGRGRSTRFIARATGASGAGADPDPELVGLAAQRAKLLGMGSRLHYEHAPLHDLPYQDGVFDVAFGEIEVAAAENPVAAVRELVRVTREGGSLVLIQLVWLRTLEPDRRDGLVRRLGIRPLLVVEWKQILRDAGVGDVVVEAWSGGPGAEGRTSLLAGLDDLASLRERLRLMPRAWRRWGWPGVRVLLSGERELRHLLEEERVLGGVVIRGRVGTAHGRPGRGRAG